MFLKETEEMIESYLKYADRKSISVEEYLSFRKQAVKESKIISKRNETYEKKEKNCYQEKEKNIKIPDKNNTSKIIPKEIINDDTDDFLTAARALEG